MSVKEQCREFVHSDNVDISCNENDVSDTIKQAIRDIIKKEGYITYTLDITPIVPDGGNFLATITKATIVGKTSSEDKEINIFIKHIFVDFNEHMNLFSIFDVHSRELYAYDELIENYYKLQVDAEVPLHERYNAPKCYNARNSEFLILEDLEKKGYTTPNRIDSISKDFARLSIQQLAKFHALSFVLQKRRPEYFDAKLKTLKIPYDFNDEWESFVNNFAGIVITEMEDDNNIKNKIKKFVPKITKIVSGCMGDTTVRCICHGDYKPNNLLMKVTDGELKKIMPIDYQFLHYGNPVTDLLFFIVSATDQQFRKDYLEYIKNLYHDTMANFLRYFKIDVEDYFPKATFETLFKQWLDYGLAVAVYLLPIILAADDDVPDFSKTSASKVQFKVRKELKNRFGGLVEDFVQWGYL
ncbi:uncharacterized protein ACR2FA_007422 [Aphomia sociella]